MGYTSVSFGTETWLRSPCRVCVNVEEDKGRCAHECKSLGKLQRKLDIFLLTNPGYCHGR